ncbi:MAG: AMP-binding protein [Gammaproteobacteria bacterium]|nr:AMP-binding protein [Gammaproteobacteria bacterium]
MMHPHVTCLADLVRIAAQRDPSATAIEHDRGQLSYAAFWERSVRLANAMLARGLKAGDRVALFSQNCHAYLESYVGLQLAGLVAVPANYRLTPPELAYLLDNSGARAMLIGEEYLPYLDRLRTSGKRVPEVVIVFGSEHADAYERVIAEAATSIPPRSFGLNDAAAIFYTSGTTGFPKGAVMSHALILTRFSSWGWRYGITEEETTLVPGPIFHQSFGSVSLITLAVGGKVVLRRDFSPERTLEDLQRFGITWAFLVPTMLSAVVKTATGLGRTLELPRLRGLMSSGSRLQMATLEGFEAAFPAARLADTYGWTESGWITYCRHEDILASDRSVGRASFGCEIAILDEAGQELPRGSEGSIYACNPVPFLGYHENPEATRSMRSGRWETGGDVGVIDERGFLHILDRKKDMIVSGGENIYPAEIEHVLTEHPKIFEVAVVGLPDEKWGESPRACVVPRPGQTLTIEEIVAFCDGRLARFKHPRSLFTLDVLPRSSMGKVLRRELREQFWKAS